MRHRQHACQPHLEAVIACKAARIGRTCEASILYTWDCCLVLGMGALGLQGNTLLRTLLSWQSAHGRAHLLDDQEDHASQVGILALVELGDAEEDIGGLFLRARPSGSANIHLALACHVQCLQAAWAEQGSCFSNQADSVPLCHPCVPTFVKVSP